MAGIIKIKVATGRQYSGVVRNVLCNDPGRTNCTMLFARCLTSELQNLHLESINTLLLPSFSLAMVRIRYAQSTQSIAMQALVFFSPFIYYRFVMLCLNPSMLFLLMGTYCVGEMSQ